MTCSIILVSDIHQESTLPHKGTPSLPPVPVFLSLRLGHPVGPGSSPPSGAALHGCWWINCLVCTPTQVWGWPQCSLHQGLWWGRGDTPLRAMQTFNAKELYRFTVKSIKSVSYFLNRNHTLCLWPTPRERRLLSLITSRFPPWFLGLSLSHWVQNPVTQMVSRVPLLSCGYWPEAPSRSGPPTKLAGPFLSVCSANFQANILHSSSFNLFSWNLDPSRAHSFRTVLQPRTPNREQVSSHVRKWERTSLNPLNPTWSSTSNLAIHCKTWHTANRTFQDLTAKVAPFAVPNSIYGKGLGHLCLLFSHSPYSICQQIRSISKMNFNHLSLRPCLFPFPAFIALNFHLFPSHAALFSTQEFSWNYLVWHISLCLPSVFSEM